MERQNWRQIWLQSINELTSLDVQKRSWLDSNNSNPHWSFSEFMNVYFDDLQLADNQYTHYINIGFVSSKEYEIVKDWHEQLSEYKAPDGDVFNHVNILNDTNWQQIVNLGMDATQKLIGILMPEEINELTTNPYVA